MKQRTFGKFFLTPWHGSSAKDKKNKAAQGYEYEVEKAKTFTSSEIQSQKR